MHHLPLLAALLSLSLLPLMARAADTSPATQPTPIPLWPNGAPDALGTKPTDIPEITPYILTSPTPTPAILIFPGGAYEHLSMDHEGRHYAEFFNLHGLSAFVVKYRLGTSGYRNPVELHDAARAMRWVRAHIADYNLNPDRLALIGSSAGGHLAATLATRFDSGDPAAPDPIDRLSSRPDAVILCYPVITMGPFAHTGSKNALLGKSSPELMDEMSAEKHVSPQTPPCFIWATWEDKTVPVENSLLFASALRENKVRFDLHIYEKGGHGLGLGDEVPPFSHALPWTNDALYWLKAQKFIP